ncbi:hypothetical protein Airi01_076170 [Actinoallomurus iriomotensis]|uniref:Uncharacterized protein n=1 Tax=Actinoallomurus iriomotensis TaxID=478107 RepID=A0A9W6RQ24_9ACTN|nr:hypothetical protein Airi01_076170 [Actinoallomurus iriomotensis]
MTRAIGSELRSPNRPTSGVAVESELVAGLGEDRERIVAALTVLSETLEAATDRTALSGSAPRPVTDHLGGQKVSLMVRGLTQRSRL